MPSGEVVYRAGKELAVKSDPTGFTKWYELAAADGAISRVYVKPFEAVPAGSGVLRKNLQMAPISLKVINMLNTDDALSNFLFVNKSDFEAMWPYTLGGAMRVNGALFSVRPHSVVEKGCVSTSMVNRTQLQVDKNHILSVTQWEASEFRAPVVFSLTVDIDVKQGNCFTVDCQDFSATFCKTLENHSLAVDRQLLVKLGNSIYGLTVKDIVLKGSAGETNTGVKEMIVSSETLHSGDVVVVTKNSKLVLENTSLKQMDVQQQQIVQSFNLENLGIGGLKEEFGKVFHRAFASRMLPISYLKKLGIKHVKGVLLYGPPGTGKTLIARKIGEILNCREPKIVNGPEVFNKFVGGTEENIRKLFEDAEAEQAAKKDQSQLHLIIFDEFDAICKQRGAVRDSTGVNDNVVNQLLSKIDGVNALNNVLLIGMTNRPDLIDDAIKRPGRFEVHVEIGLPNEEGRQEIFRIHTLNMRENHMVTPEVDLKYLAAKTENYSGAEIEGVVRAATASALIRHIDLENAGGIIDPQLLKVSAADFEHGLEEVQPAFGRAEEVCESLLRGGILDYGPVWQKLWSRLCRDIALLQSTTSRVESVAILLHGRNGCGKSAVAATLARHTGFPYVKVLSSDDMVGYGDLQRVNIIRKAFEDAYKSPSSCILLDDIERLINFSALGGRYSNDILQGLLVLVKRPPPPGHKLLVIGTTSNYNVTCELEIDSVFPLKAEIPLITQQEFAKVIEEAGYEVLPDFSGLSLSSVLTSPMPIKQVLLLLEMAADAEKRIDLASLESSLESSF